MQGGSCLHPRLKTAAVGAGAFLRGTNGDHATAVAAVPVVERAVRERTIYSQFGIAVGKTDV